MILTAILLFAQSGLELPPLGYFPARDGRLYPLYGMRANFVLGPPLEEGVLQEVRLDPMTLRKTTAGVEIAGRLLHDDALRENRILATSHEGRRVAWIASSRRLVTWNGAQFVTVERAGAAWERLVWDGDTLRVLTRETVEADLAALDSDEHLWRASAANVTCDGRQWELESTAQSLHPLHEGWMLIRTAERLYAAHCRSSDVYVVPEPAP